MEKYLIIYGHKDNTAHTKNFTWRENKEEAEKFVPYNPDYMVFQIIKVKEGKQY